MDDIFFHIILISCPHPISVEDLFYFLSRSMAIAYNLPSLIRYRDEPPPTVIPIGQYSAPAVGHGLYTAIQMVGVAPHSSDEIFFT